MGIDRKDIDDKYKWKIDLMYSSQESIDKDISKTKSYILYIVMEITVLQVKLI